MHRTIATATLLLILALGATAWAATNYSAMSTDELAAKRGAMQGATVEERKAFQNEWQKRLQKMTPEEHQKYMREQGTGPGKAQGMGPGSGPMDDEKREEMRKRMEERQDTRQERREERQDTREQRRDEMQKRMEERHDQRGGMGPGGMGGGRGR